MYIVEPHLSCQEDTNLSVDDNETPEKVVTLSKSTSEKIQGKKVDHVEL